MQQGDLWGGPRESCRYRPAEKGRCTAIIPDGKTKTLQPIIQMRADPNQREMDINTDSQIFWLAASPWFAWVPCGLQASEIISVSLRSE